MSPKDAGQVLAAMIIGMNRTGLRKKASTNHEASSARYIASHPELPYAMMPDVAFLEVVRKSPTLADDRTAVRELIKEANLILGYRKLSYLPYSVVYSVLERLALEPVA